MTRKLYQELYNEQYPEKNQPKIYYTSDDPEGRGGI